MSNSAILTTIKALLAKTTANGCTEAEALAAAEKAAELMDRHGFDTADLEEREEIGIDIYLAKGKRLGAVSFVAPVIAEFCDVKVWSVRKAEVGKMNYFGRESDVAVAIYLTHLIHTAFESSWDAYYEAKVKPVPLPQRRNGHTLRKAFDVGMANRLNERLRAMKAARNVAKDGATGRTGLDLVVVKGAEVEAAFRALSLKLSGSGQAKTRGIDANAFHAGQAAGDMVSITSGVGGGGYTQALLT